MRQLRHNESWVPEDIRGTLKINPASHSPQVSANRLASFRHALAGVLHMLRYQSSARILLAITVLVVIVMSWLQLPLVEVAIIALVTGLVWVTEFINTAIESAVNLATAEYHPMARVAKDIAGGATLVASITALFIGLLILLPPLLARLNAL